ncbi:putative Heparinase II/III family protein [Magnetofaba australis IT-1]|uniref:Putative Heparinase II/III family protein n=1 Tax=Magnetofaba australis IT-1 TaxID=1434232 RepID=A0A1Y2KB09_9PROT|nr:putative Heparinase II/III family protein [Magnetofaba australis IT-1]
MLILAPAGGNPHVLVGKPGGVGLYTRNLLRRMEPGVEMVHFVTGKRPGDPGWLWPLRLLGDAIRLKWTLFFQRFDIIHLNPSLNPKSTLRDALFLATIIGMRWWRRPRVLVFFRGWEWSTADAIQRSGWKRRGFRFLFGAADHILVLASTFRQRLEQLGFDGARIELAATMFDGDLIPTEPAPPHDEIGVLFLSSMNRNKGVTELLEGFAQVAAELPQLRLTLAGEGSARAGAQTWVAAQGLGDVVSLPGYVSGAAKGALLQQADIFALPSRHGEGCPNALLEAMGAGCAVIASRAGGIPDVITSDEHGELLPEVSAAAVADALRKLAGDSERLARCQAHNRETAWARYESRQAAREMAQRYRRMLIAPASATGGGKLRWYAARLRAMSLGEIAYRAQRAVQKRLERRGWLTLPQPPAPTIVPATTWLKIPENEDPTVYTAAADAILAGTIPLFDEPTPGLGQPPNFNADPATGDEPFAAGGADRKHSHSNPEKSRAKRRIWELNRHLHWVTLAQAWRVSGDKRYRDALLEQMRAWLDQCPYRTGPNWTSPLEMGVRLINWALVWQILGGPHADCFQGGLGQELRDRLLAAVMQQAHYIQRHLSRHTSANNHLIGELAGLYVASRAWPYWPALARWGEDAKWELNEQIHLQVHVDGVGCEQTLDYQGFIAEFFLIAALVGARTDDAFNAAYSSRMERMLAFLHAMLDAGGHLPQIGDADNGRAFCLNPARDPAPQALLRLGAVCFARADFQAQAGALDVQSRWLMGAHGRDRWAALARTPKAPRKQAFPQGGYYILGQEFETADEVHACVDCGPLGYLAIAAHGHADALALTLSLGGVPILVDPGTYDYHAGKQWRSHFRSTAAHNTVSIDGADQSTQSGPFLWLNHAQSACEAWEPEAADDLFVGVCHGYERLPDPLTHRREARLFKAESRLTTQDELICRAPHEATRTWQFAAGAAVTQSGPQEVEAVVGPWRVTLRADEADARLEIITGREEPPAGWVSDRYGRKQAAPCVRFINTVAAATTLKCEIRWRRDADTEEYQGSKSHA